MCSKTATVTTNTHGATRTRPCSSRSLKPNRENANQPNVETVLRITRTILWTNLDWRAFVFFLDLTWRPDKRIRRRLPWVCSCGCWCTKTRNISSRRARSLCHAFSHTLAVSARRTSAAALSRPWNRGASGKSQSSTVSHPSTGAGYQFLFTPKSYPKAGMPDMEEIPFDSAHRSVVRARKTNFSIPSGGYFFLNILLLTESHWVTWGWAERLSN